MLPVVIGRGKLYVNGTAMGNCSQVRLGPKIEVARYNDYSTGIRRVGKSRISSRGCGGSFQTDYITSANMSLYLAGVELATLSFVTKNARGIMPNPIYTLTNVTIWPSGETDLVGDNYQTLQFGFEGTLEPPSVNVSGTTTTSTTTTSTTSTSTTTTSTTTTTTT